MKKNIPIHDFSEEDTRNVPIRYIPLDVRTDYDLAEAHRHNYYEIFFFSKGGGSHLIDFKDYEVEDNSIHIVYPGQVHLLRRELSSHGAVVHFSEELYSILPGMRDLLYNSVSVLKNAGQQEEISSLLAQLNREYSRETINVEVMKAYLQIAVLKCVELYKAGPSGDTTAVPDRFIDFRKLLEKEFLQQKSPGYFAERLNIGERKLNELCRTAVGMTAGDYIKKRLILEAKRLLFNSDMSIKEISFYLGFEDPSYFNRFFKKNHGATAGDFRREIKIPNTGIPPVNNIFA